MRFLVRQFHIKLLAVGVFVSFALLTAFFRPSGPANAQSAIGGQIGTPTGVSATVDLYATKVGIYWDAVRDATVYRIYRSSVNDSSTATEVGSTPAFYFFDLSATAGTQSFYWVKAENSQTSSSFSSVAAGRRAIGNNSPGAPFPPLQPPPFPTGNQITAAKAYLGKTLFWDEQLSSTKTVSCGTCHRPADGGSDPRTSPDTRNPGFDNILGTADDVFGSPGVPVNNADGTYGHSAFFGLNAQITNRRAPSYLNAGYTTDGLFWDGRATDQFRDPLTNSVLLSSFAGLESQSIFPPLSTVEMGHAGRDWLNAASRVASSKPLALATDIPSSLTNWIDGRSYAELFQEAFGTPDVTPSRIAMALATHQRTLFSDQTPIDIWSAQIEPLTQQEETGRQIFVNQNCIFCHGGALLSNATYQNIGVRPIVEDLGRGAITGIPDDRGRFKTPPLRNLELRAPFMHNGRFETIEDVVEFYNRGGDFPAPNTDPRVRPLNLTVQQRAALSAFLKRPLTDPRVANELPPFDRPTLYTETDRVPIISGSGRVGTNGVEPVAVAIEPPLAGNDNFTIAVSNGLAGAQAVLVVDAADPGSGSSIPSGGSFARVETILSGTGSDGYGSAVLAIPNSPGIVGRTLFGRWYIVDGSAQNGFSVSKLIRFTVFGDAAAKAPFDLDGDGKTDIAVARPGAEIQWWINQSSTASTVAYSFGAANDVIAPADLTGDGKTDIAVFRPENGFWYVLRSEDLSFYAFPFGVAGDRPAPADYDGDGRADVAVFRPASGTWFIQRSSDNSTYSVPFGLNGDVPIPADFDGDGRTDVAVFRPSSGIWWINRSTAGTIAVQFGEANDKPFAGDVTGDGKADIGLWRPSDGNWFVVRSEDSSYFAFPFGATGDIPAPGDYDGDGRIDAAVFRPSNGTWYIQRSTAGTLITAFGQTGDRPLPNSFIP